MGWSFIGVFIDEMEIENGLSDNMVSTQIKLILPMLRRWQFA